MNKNGEKEMAKLKKNLGHEIKKAASIVVSETRN
jgi:hypothetical protein